MKSLSWVGTVFGVIGACLVALNTGLQDFGYICFLVGSLSWLVVSINAKNSAAIMQWLIFSFINGFGLLAYLK